MGSCHCQQNVNKNNVKANNKQIDKYMNQNKKINKTISKLLLLGVGSSGKSTLFRQLENIYGDGFNNEFINSASSYVRDNCIHAIVKLLEQSENLSSKYIECKINSADNDISDAIQLIISNSSLHTNINNMSSTPTNSDPLEADLESIGYAIELIWSLRGIKKTFDLRQYFCVYENMDHFFNKISIIFDKDYIPTTEDLLKVRVRSTGIVENKYNIQNIPIHIFDVGGQRTERKKWIQLFEGVHGLIFVAALSHYASVLFEDENKNSMLESLEVFDEICNLKWFASTQIILFLNKDDMFRKRLKNKIPLSLCFGDEYVGPNYSDKCNIDSLSDDEWFNRCYNESVDFIKKKFIARNRRSSDTVNNQLYIHVTSAIEQNSIEIVFMDIVKSVTRKNVKNVQKAGLL